MTPEITVNRFCFDPQALPAGYAVREMKYCENCMANFVRDACRCRLRALLAGLSLEEVRCGCAKYCSGCIGRLLLPLDLQDYKVTLPREAEMKHATHLPRYDNSLLPKEQRRVYTQQLGAPAQPRQYCSRNRYGDWKARLCLAFAKQVQLSGQEIQDVIGCPGAPFEAVGLCRSSGFKLRGVGYGPRLARYGRPPRIYEMEVIIH